MAFKRKNILTCLVIILIIIFIYIPLRTGMLEQQFVKSIISSTEKIVMSLSSFEKDKKLRDKDLSKFFTIAKDKFPLAFIAAADKNNKILKAGKNEKYIKSTAAFDSIIDSFQKNDYKVTNKNDFVIKYYDQSRFYVFPRNLPDGRLLVVYPYILNIKLVIQLILEILLITIFSIFLTAIISLRRGKKSVTDKKTIEVVRKEVRKKSAKAEKPEKQDRKEKKQELKEQAAKPDEETINIKDTDKARIDFESLNSYVYELFTYISKEYKSESASLFVISEDSSRMDKIFELKGNAFIKISNSEFNSISMNPEIIEEMKNSSIMLLEKGKRVTIPILYRNALLGMINIHREKEFRGPEINDIAERLQAIAKPLSGHILLSEILPDKA